MDQHRWQGAMKLTKRDEQTVLLVDLDGACTAEQLRTAFYSARERDTRCRHRLTQLVRHQYLSTLPQLQNEPAVFVLSGQSRRGNQLVHERLGKTQWRPEKDLRRHVEHTLAISELHSRFIRGCQELEFRLLAWQRANALTPLLAHHQLIPDAFGVVSRIAHDGSIKLSGTFFEVERMSRDLRTLRSKLLRYRTLYQTDYATLFQLRGMRLCIVYDIPNEATAKRRVERGVALAAKLQMPTAYFASLTCIKQRAPAECLTAPIWRTPRSPEPVALFGPDAAPSTQ